VIDGKTQYTGTALLLPQPKHGRVFCLGMVAGTETTRQHGSTQLPSRAAEGDGDNLPDVETSTLVVHEPASVVLSLMDTHDEAIYCGLCLEHRTDIVRSCRHGHQWCKPCLAGYVESQIACNQLNVRCPWLDEATTATLERCTEYVEETTITEIIDTPTALKYHRFKALRDPLMRECPLRQADGTSCLHLQKGTARRPAMVCKQCSGTYCFVHANAHPGETCRAYAKRQKAITKANDWYLKQVSKRCPSCKAPTQKGEGCIHMTCSQCSAHWCWVCGAKVHSGSSDHFSPLNPFGCGAAMMIDDFITTSYPRNVLHFMALAAARVAIAPFYALALVTAIPTVLILCVVCLPSICYPCFDAGARSFYSTLRLLLCGAESQDRLPASFLLFAAGYWPLAILGVVTMLAISPLMLVCCGYRSGRCHDWFNYAGRRRERLLTLLALFSLWPCVLSLIVLFLAAIVGLLPATLMYALMRAPRFGAQLDLPT